jgi:hypothetical protein
MQREMPFRATRIISIGFVGCISGGGCVRECSGPVNRLTYAVLFEWPVHNFRVLC